MEEPFGHWPDKGERYLAQNPTGTDYCRLREKHPQFVDGMQSVSHDGEVLVVNKMLHHRGDGCARFKADDVIIGDELGVITGNLRFLRRVLVFFGFVTRFRAKFIVRCDDSPAARIFEMSFFFKRLQIPPNGHFRNAVALTEFRDRPRTLRRNYFEDVSPTLCWNHI